MLILHSTANITRLQLPLLLLLLLFLPTFGLQSLAQRMTGLDFLPTLLPVLVEGAETWALVWVGVEEEQHHQQVIQCW